MTRNQLRENGIATLTSALADVGLETNRLAFGSSGDISSSVNLTYNGTELAAPQLNINSSSASISSSGNITGQTITANSSFSGPGSGITTLNASNIATGTLSDARLTTNVTVQGNTFNGASQLVQMTAGTLLPAVSGINLTNLNASNIASGSLALARLTAGSNGEFLSTSGGVATWTTNGSTLTSLNASNISSGTLDAARLADSGATAATYTLATVTVDAKGRVTSASNGAGAAGGTPITKVKTATSSDSTGVIATDAAFTQAMGAGEVWVVEGYIFYTSTSTADFQAQVEYSDIITSETTFAIEQWGDSAGASTMKLRSYATGSGALSSAATLVNFNFGSAVPNGFLRIHGRVTTQNAGNFIFQWSARTAAAQANLIGGSYIRYQRIS